MIVRQGMAGHGVAGQGAAGQGKGSIEVNNKGAKCNIH